jgi:hypothetical protein
MKTRLLLYGDTSIEVPFPRESVKAYWRAALERGERFINFDSLWVRTDLIYAIAAVRSETDR